MNSFTTVPLKSLVVTNLNVRKTDVDVEIDKIADDIAAHGILQNLIVTELLDGTFGVLDGQRRRLGLLRLVDRGDIALDFPVPVQIRDDIDGREISLASNVTRIAMNPADEVIAYAEVVADLEHADDPAGWCARRFGVTRGYVAQRLRLAALAPDILEALRVGRIGELAAQAYASVADLELQMTAFRGEEERTFGGAHNPKFIRDALLQRTHPADVKQARYLGLDVYEASGGVIDRDLWMLPTEPDRLLHPSLLDRLARDKALAEAGELAGRDGFASGEIANGFTTMPIWPKPRAGFVSPLDPIPAVKMRGDAIGLYALSNETAELELRAWWKPIAQPAIAPAPRLPAEPSPAFAEQHRRLVDDSLAEIDGTALAGRQVRAREVRVYRAAAHLVVERALAAGIAGQLCWPADDGWVPTIAGLDDSDGTILVAVQIRVPRAEWEAALPDAEAQVAQEVEFEPEAGGGVNGEPPSN